MTVAGADRRGVGWEGPPLDGLEALLADPSTTDVVVNGHREVWVDRGSGLELTGLRFVSEPRLRRLAQALVATAGRRLDEGQPWADVLLAGRVRVHAILPPVALGGTCLSLRVHRRTPLSLASLEAGGTVPRSARRVLVDLLAEGVTLVISGATGAGKTTLLQALLATLSAAQRVLVVEEAPELFPDHPHVVHLTARPPNVEGRGAVTLRDLVRQALRMRPDHLVLGEVRGPEVVDLLSAFNTGHSGSATIHASSAADTPSRLVALCALAGVGESAADRLVGAAVDVVCHISRDAAGHRRLGEIARLVTDTTGRTRTTPLWRAGPSVGSAPTEASVPAP